MEVVAHQSPGQWVDLVIGVELFFRVFDQRFELFGLSKPLPDQRTHRFHDKTLNHPRFREARRIDAQLNLGRRGPKDASGIAETLGQNNETDPTTFANAVTRPFEVCQLNGDGLVFLQRLNELP